MDEESDKHFSNSKEELEFYKNTYKLNFEELSSCKSKIKVLENINNKLKEKIIQTHPKNIENNDSSKVVFTNNEFKNFWESMIQTELIESFDFCIKEYKLISHFSQDMMLLIYEETKKIIEQKFLDILKCLNLSKTSKDKKDSLYIKMIPFFRENFNNIFEFDEEKMKYIKDKLKNVISQYNFLNETKIMANASSRTLSDILKNNNENNANSKGNRSNRNSNINPNINMNSEIYKLLENKIRGKNFEGVMKSFFSICLYMLLHDPVLNFDIEKYPKRKLIYYFYNKKDFINVEGFGNDKTPCVIILSPPSIKKKFAFSGLRPAVYTLSGDIVNSEILQQCKINEKKKEEEVKSKENNEEIKDKKIMKYNTSNDSENKLKKNANISNININKSISNSKPLNYNQNINSDKKKNSKSNKDDIIEYNRNTTYNNMKNNYIKILNNKSLKVNKIITNGVNLNQNNDSYKIINRNNINDNNKNKLKNNFPKHINNDKDKNNYKLDNNNPKISHQNLSQSYIQIQNNIKDKNNKINISKTKSNDKNNYSNDIKNAFYDNNINLISRKEKTLQGKLQQKNNEFIIYDNNPFLNSSQKIERPKDIINNNNYINQNVIIKDIYENNKQKDNMPKNIGNYQLNINSKSQDKKKKITKSYTCNTNYIDNKNINIYLNEENQKNTHSKPKNTYNDKIINYNNINYNNNNLNYQNNYEFEKYPKSNGTNTPSSEKINIKYYSSLGSILNNPNYNFSKQVSDTNNNNINNYYYTAEKRNNKDEYDFNNKEKKINFYSYGSNSYNNNENMNKYTERKGIIYPLNDSDYINNVNVSKNINIINNSNIDIEKTKNYEPSSHKKNFNVLKISNNSKEKKQYYHSLKKNNLNPLFNFINNSNEKNIKYSIYDLKEKHSLNNKFNYIENFKNPNNNINYYNNIYNNSSSLISCNNIYENLNNIDNFGNSSKQLRNSINDNNNNNNERRNKDKDLSKATPESKYYKLGNSKMTKFGGQNSMEIKIKENNKKEINDFLEKYNQLSKERNQLEKCFAPIYLDVHNKTKKNKNILGSQNNNNNVNNQNEDDINISNNNNFINGKNRIFASKELLPKNKTYNEVSMKSNNKYNMMENSLNKKRNKSLNNNIQKIIKDENQNYYIINNISDIMLDENRNRNKGIFFKYSGDNINKIDYDDEFNEKENYNNSKGTNNTSYNLTNYYLNEIEVLKLNDKYKFNGE